jgi:hypothetical protein
MMNTTVTKAALLVSLCVAMSTQDGHADDKQRDFYFQEQQQRFVNQPFDARMLGMSGSTNLTTANALATVQNPGGLGLMRYGDLSASYSFNEISGQEYPSGANAKDKQNIGQVYGATPINPTADGLPDGGNFGMGWWGRSGDWTYDRDNTDSGTYQVSGAYGKAISDYASLGYGLTYQNDSLDSDIHDYDSGETFLHTVGVQTRSTNDLIWGATISIGHGQHDLDHKGHFADDQTVKQMQYGIATGFEYRMDRTAVALGADYTFYSNNGDDAPLANDPGYPFGGDSMGRVMNIRVGLEQYLDDWIAIRGGYRYASNFKWDYDRSDLRDLTGSAEYNAWTAGAGVKYDTDEDSFIRAILLDYAAEYRAVGNNDWQHFVTLSTPFDLCM